MAHAGRRPAFRSVNICSRLRALQTFRHLETAAHPSHRTGAWRRRYSTRRHDGRSLRRTCLISDGMVQSSITMATRKESNGRPQISQVQPEAAITGGELYIRGKSLTTSDRPRVTIGDVTAPVVIGSSSLVIVKVPEGASAGELIVENGNFSSDAWTCDIGIQVAEKLHPVTRPAVES